MVVGVGVDAIEIDRVSRAIRGDSGGRFRDRVYTGAEWRYVESKGNAADQTAAGLFAAKEAVAKALGTGIRGFGFADIEILPDALGKPNAMLYGGARERMRAVGAERVHVSITHAQTMAMAFAVLDSREVGACGQ